MTDSNGQYMFDFGDLVKPSAKGTAGARTRLRASEAVPQEWMQTLRDVRNKTGIRHKEIAEKAGVGVGFCSHALNNHQRVSFEEYAKLKDALADIIFQRILDA